MSEPREHSEELDEETPPPRDDVVSEAAPRADSASLEAQLNAARKRVDDLARAYQASEKEREDFKVRMTRERERMMEVEKADVAIALVEAVDELDLCLTASDRSPLAEGVRLIRGNLLKKIESLGLTRLELLGHRFDPNLAEAADMEVTGVEDDDQKITAVMRAGYVQKNRVVRPARVKVARFIAPAHA